jgi:hypothetical protein
MMLRPLAGESTHLTPSASVRFKISLRRILILVACAAIFLSPFTYIGNYAGDSQVHLVYGENAAQGRFFEFNPGEKSPGVTSPGYMLMIASFFKIAPDNLVPAMVKVMNLLIWYGLLITVFLIARRLMESNAWAFVVALVAGLLPGSVYNSTIGMENGIFAFLVFLWVYLAVRDGWFTTSDSSSERIKYELVMGGLMGLACWIRPEGFIVAAIALSYRALMSMGSRSSVSSTIVRSAAFLVTFSILAALLGYFHYSQTGYLVPTSGVSRILMSRIASDSFELGPIFVSIKFAVRLAQYFPLTILWLVGNWVLIKGLGVSKESNGALGFLAVLSWSGFILYSTIFGAVHLSRYVIFIMPAMVLVAVHAAKWLWSLDLPKSQPLPNNVLRGTLVVLAIALGGVFLVETDLRTRLDSQASLWKSMRAPSQRENFSDQLFQLLGQPQELPISVAMQEVQARYWLDDRFVVRSLDGRVDPALLKYVDNDRFDHVGYIRERKVRFLLDTPNYNRDKDLWSLDRLNELQPGEDLSRDGLTFSSLPVESARQANTADSPSTNSRWTAKTDSAAALRFFVVKLIRIDHGETE